jgi:hypothetical protein
MVLLVSLLAVSQILFHSTALVKNDSTPYYAYETYLPDALRRQPLSYTNRTKALQGLTNAPAAPMTAKYAYAFVIGGCKPEKPSYRFFIHNILIAARVLREGGSKADIVVFFQMGFKSEYDRLLEEDVRLLRAMDIKFKYIPKNPQESFYRTVLDKFRILSLTEYRRVILMDGDVMPATNLDYLFEMSDGPDATLKENLVVAGKIEPANAGFFMLAPKQGDLEHINEIIKKREQRARELSYPYFDPIEGWGHAFVPGDQWQSLFKTGRNWTFWSAFGELSVATRRVAKQW